MIPVLRQIAAHATLSVPERSRVRAVSLNNRDWNDGFNNRNLVLNAFVGSQAEGPTFRAGKALLRASIIVFSSRAGLADFGEVIPVLRQVAAHATLSVPERSRVRALSLNNRDWNDRLNFFNFSFLYTIFFIQVIDKAFFTFYTSLEANVIIVVDFA